MPPKKETKEGPKIAEPEAESISTETRLAEKLRDASVAFLEESKAPANDTEAAALEALAQKVLKDFPGHLPVLLWQLKRAEAAASEKKVKLCHFPTQTQFRMHVLSQDCRAPHQKSHQTVAVLCTQLYFCQIM